MIFFFNTLHISLHSLACIVWGKRPNEILTLLPLQVRYFFPLASYNIFFFSLVSAVWIWHASTYNFRILILLDVLWTSWICDLVSVINFGKYSAIAFQIFLLFFFFFLLFLIFALCIHYTFFNFPTIQAMRIFFFFSSHFSLRSFYWHIIKFHDSCLAVSSLLMSPS